MFPALSFACAAHPCLVALTPRATSVHHPSLLNPNTRTRKKKAHCPPDDAQHKDRPPPHLAWAMGYGPRALTSHQPRTAPHRRRGGVSNRNPRTNPIPKHARDQSRARPLQPRGGGGSLLVIISNNQILSKATPSFSSSSLIARFRHCLFLLHTSKPPRPRPVVPSSCSAPAPAARPRLRPSRARADAVAVEWWGYRVIIRIIIIIE